MGTASKVNANASPGTEELIAPSKPPVPTVVQATAIVMLLTTPAPAKLGFPAQIVLYSNALTPAEPTESAPAQTHALAALDTLEVPALPSLVQTIATTTGIVLDPTNALATLAGLVLL